jgi:hypothetical protein
MLRALTALAIVVSMTGGASAGPRCKRLPAVVYWSDAADVHDDGTWHRTKRGAEASGRLDPKALARFKALRARSTDKSAGGDAKSIDKQLVGCLDALIAAPDGAAATKACATAAKA